MKLLSVAALSIAALVVRPHNSLAAPASIKPGDLYTGTYDAGVATYSGHWVYGGITTLGGNNYRPHDWSDAEVVLKCPALATGAFLVGQTCTMPIDPYQAKQNYVRRCIGASYTGAGLLKLWSEVFVCMPNGNAATSVGTPLIYPFQTKQPNAAVVARWQVDDTNAHLKKCSSVVSPLRVSPGCKMDDWVLVGVPCKPQTSLSASTVQACQSCGTNGFSETQFRCANVTGNVWSVATEFKPATLPPACPALTAGVPSLLLQGCKSTDTTCWDAVNTAVLTCVKWSATCGNSVIEGTEACDRGSINGLPTSGCSSACTVSPNWVCTGASCTCVGGFSGSDCSQRVCAPTATPPGCVHGTCNTVTGACATCDLGYKVNSATGACTACDTANGYVSVGGGVCGCPGGAVLTNGKCACPNNGVAVAPTTGGVPSCPSTPVVCPVFSKLDATTNKCVCSPDCTTGGQPTVQLLGGVASCTTTAPPANTVTGAPQLWWWGGAQCKLATCNTTWSTFSASTGTCTCDQTKYNALCADCKTPSTQYGPTCDQCGGSGTTVSAGFGIGSTNANAVGCYGGVNGNGTLLCMTGYRGATCGECNYGYAFDGATCVKCKQVAVESLEPGACGVCQTGWTGIACSVSDPTSPSWSTGYRYGVGFYALGGDGERSLLVSRDNCNPFFQPALPTIVVIPGGRTPFSDGVVAWQTAINTTGLSLGSAALLGPTVTPVVPPTTITAGGTTGGQEAIRTWMHAGWNVVAFLWGNLRVEDCWADAEAKIWSTNALLDTESAASCKPLATSPSCPSGAIGMRFAFRNGTQPSQYQCDPASTFPKPMYEVMLSQYLSAFSQPPQTTSPAQQPPQVHVVGERLGAQLALSLARLSDSPTNPVPTSLVMLNPVWARVYRTPLSVDLSSQISSASTADCDSASTNTRCNSARLASMWTNNAGANKLRILQPTASPLALNGDGQGLVCSAANTVKADIALCGYVKA